MVNEASAGECPADEVVTNGEMEDVSDLISLADIQQEGKPYHRQSYAERVKTSRATPLHTVNTSNTNKDCRTPQRRKSPIQCTGSSDCCLHASRCHDNGNSHSHQSQCKGIFITRLHHATDNRNIDEHVYSETGVRVKSEKLKTKFDSYASLKPRNCHTY